MVIIDDCDTPGINKVARFIKSLPHYEIFAAIGQAKSSRKYSAAERLVELVNGLIPFRKKVFPNFTFKTRRQLGLDYRCIAFRKTGPDKRNWDWDAPI